MTKRVLILGAGFGGLELATRLDESLAGEVSVTLIDQNDSFIFGFEKFEIMLGHRTADELRSYYRDIAMGNVDFRRERVTAIDPAGRTAVTDGGTYEADILVIALGADYDFEATPGFVEGGHEFYSVAGAERLRDVLPTFEEGVVLIAVLGLPFKCPPAPYEGALLLHDYFTQRGVRDRIKIRLITPEERPVPVSDQVSSSITRALADRGIELTFKRRIRAVDPARRVAELRDEAVDYDLFCGIPVHKVPDVVAESGLAVDGWIPVDQSTLMTRFDCVYALGDVASAPVPRAGVFAERAAVSVAEHIAARVRGGDSAPFDGAGICYIEFGGGLVGKVDANFLGGRDPVGIFFDPSEQGAEEKALFASSRRQRWFGR
jgi:sulfide:quinone oxidoreductase